jgi:hypothetical protein
MTHKGIGINDAWAASVTREQLHESLSGIVKTKFPDDSEAVINEIYDLLHPDLIIEDSPNDYVKDNYPVDHLDSSDAE